MAFHKRIRLENYDYNTDGIYYLTIYTEKRKQMLSRATDAVIPKVVSALKRYTAKGLRCKVWQMGCHDHVVRDNRDCLGKWEYIANHPARWMEDEYYGEGVQ